MPRKKTMRLTVKPHLESYMDSLKMQLGTEDSSEALNYLLTTLKLTGYQLGAQVMPPVGSTPLAAPPLSFSEPVYQEPSEDATVKRLARLIEEF